MQLRGALLGIALAACGGDDGTQDGTLRDAPGGAGEPAELAGITAAHNQIRAMVATATPLPPLEWDPALAATAAAWVAMCRDQEAPTGLIDHNPNRSTGSPYYIGENAFGAGGAPAANSGQQAVSLWASEGASYDYATNTCNGNCGHYTQIVWRATLKLGCAVGDCPSLAYRTALICDYGPGGNTSNQRPY
jgi:pathogenesis-related protein 1